MVIGMKTANRRGPSVQLDYQIHLQEIKPWPPSQSLKSLRNAVIQWEHGDKFSGSTNPAVPSLGSGSNVGDGKIEFNYTFRLPVTLLRDVSVRGGNGDTFQKNCLELNLFEPRRDKTVKGQLLATAVIDLADYGIVKEALSITAPMNCKRVLSNKAPPMLFLKIQRFLKNRGNALLRDASMDRSGNGSVSALMNEEYAEEAEIASSTDDDVSSHSSAVVPSSAIEPQGALSPEEKENILKTIKEEISANAQDYNILHLKHRIEETGMKPVNERHDNQKESPSCSSSTDMSFDSDSQENLQSTVSNFHEPSFMLIENEIGTRSVQSSSSSTAYEGRDVELIINNSRNEQDNSAEHEQESTRVAAADTIEKGCAVQDNSKKNQENGQNLENGQGTQIVNEELHHIVDEQSIRSPLDDTRKEFASESDALSVTRENVGDRSNSVKSVRSPLDSRRSNGVVLKSSQTAGKEKDVGVLKYTKNGVRTSIYNEREDVNVYTKDSKIQQLQCRINMLEGELTEAAAIEVSLYSVVAEHGSSINKVHAPARRLSRLYLHACKEKSRSRIASAARSVISGLVLAAKACGNDVPRLSFWLSNSIVLRAILGQACDSKKMTLSSGHSSEATTFQKGNNDKISALKWNEATSGFRKDTGSARHQNVDQWEDHHTFTSALESIETWIFTRIVESIWWQILTPRMQSFATNDTNSFSSKLYGKSCLGDEGKGNFSLELWKKAFSDAYERICPIRAGRHECGCLQVISKLIMEQCLARLDVAMFNAILRESADDIPTDPVSDPITDAKVLPIPPGKASFGAGAQLRTAIGIWSGWLTDQLGLDVDDPTKNGNKQKDNDVIIREECDTSFKSFHLLHALSDLMMLPKDMLLSRSIRKEVCPRFTSAIIRRILNSFGPDEFCPDPIPDIVLEAFESEDPTESDENSIQNIPCSADCIVYIPPSAASVSYVLGDCGSRSQLTRTGSLVLRKSYTSDDELDELESASSINSFWASPSSTKPGWTSKEDGSKNSNVRYQLIREIWKSMP